ncbi:MAG: hypothetical protein LBF61_02730 [Azoarcus sp.]|jgi:hypothetical protein|nr:hypothetical protein [Azoarcus sp.]
MNPVDLSELSHELSPPWLFSTLCNALDAAQYLIEQPPWTDNIRSGENIEAVLRLARIAAAVGAKLHGD